MMAEEYLKNLKKLDTVINQNMKELDNLRIMSKKIKSIDCSIERVQTSPSANASFVNTIVRMVDLSEKIDKQIDYYVSKKDKIINQIQTLSDQRYIQILYARYVEYKELKQIADEMGYSYPHIRRLLRQALREFEIGIPQSH